MPQDARERNKKMTEWKKENRDRINVLFKKGTKEEVQAKAKDAGESPSEYIRKALEMRMYGSVDIKRDANIIGLGESEIKRLKVAAEYVGVTPIEFINEAVKEKLKKVEDDLFS